MPSNNIRRFPGSYEQIELIASSTRSYLDRKLKRNEFDSLNQYLIKVVEYLNGEITYGGIGAMYEDIESLVIFPDEKFRIILSPITTVVRDNFTIAHELGHYLLHYDPEPIYTENITFNRYGSNEFEWQANRFAAAFLMPAREFKHFKAQFNKNPYRLAAHFEVSYKAIEIRLQYI